MKRCWEDGRNDWQRNEMMGREVLIQLKAAYIMLGQVIIAR